MRMSSRRRASHASAGQAKVDEAVAATLANADVLAIGLVAHRRAHPERCLVVLPRATLGDLGAQAFEREVQHRGAHLLADSLALVAEAEPRAGLDCLGDARSSLPEMPCIPTTSPSTTVTNDEVPRLGLPLRPDAPVELQGAAGGSFGTAFGPGDRERHEVRVVHAVGRERGELGEVLVTRRSELDPRRHDPQLEQGPVGRAHRDSVRFSAVRHKRFGEPSTEPVRSLHVMGRAPLVLADEASVAAAYRAHGPELYRAAVRSLSDGPLAEEAVQEVFVRAWRAADRYDPLVASLRTWLFAILRNVVVDMARARAVRPQLASEALADRDAASGIDEFDRALASWQVEEALLRVSDEHRVALVEVHVRGRPYGEVAADLGVPVGTLKSRVYYGLKALRLALEELGWVDDE